jgi:hypothetical protein
MDWVIQSLTAHRSPLTAETNRQVIKARLPNTYLPELIEQSGETTVRGILESHFISPIAFDILLRKPFGPDDFEAFIAERQRTLQDAIEDLLIKEHLDLSPKLRELDAATEQVELNLRKTIEATLSSLLPPVQHLLAALAANLVLSSHLLACLDASPAILAGE